MDGQSKLDPSVNPADVDHSRTTTRRAFLDGAGRKALFMAPVIVTLSAQQALAEGSRTVSCTVSGDPCVTDEECCSGDCMGNNECAMA